MYMVVGPISLSAGSPDVNKLCSVAGCRTDSLAVRVSDDLLRNFVTLLDEIRLKHL